MADTNVSTQVNFDPIIRDINARIRNLRDIAPALNEIGQMGVASVRARITRSKTDPSGNAWSPWAPATRRERTRRGTASRGLLYDSGRLLNSISYRLVRNSVEVYSSVPYAQYLQFGTNKMPARKFLGWSENDKVAMSDIVNKYLARQ